MAIMSRHRHQSSSRTPARARVGSDPVPRCPPRRQNAASVIRLVERGRLLMVFSQGDGLELRNDAAIMQTHSDDGGETWSEPRPVYAYPGWFCSRWALARLADGDVRLLMGRIRYDFSLGGTEPMTGWWSRRARPTTVASRGPSTVRRSACSPIGPSSTGRATRTRCPTAAGSGRSWAPKAGTSAGMRASTTGPDGDDFGPPIVIARAAGRDYSDIDVACVSTTAASSPSSASTRRSGASTRTQPTRERPGRPSSRRSSARTSSS